MGLQICEWIRNQENEGERGAKRRNEENVKMTYKNPTVDHVDTWEGFFSNFFFL